MAHRITKTKVSSVLYDTNGKIISRMRSKTVLIEEEVETPVPENTVAKSSLDAYLKEKNLRKSNEVPEIFRILFTGE